MKNSEYKALHDLPKKTKSTHLLCAANGQQANYDGFALLEPSNTFKVIQNRKGHRRTNGTIPCQGNTRKNKNLV